MILHAYDVPRSPARVVVLGATGVIGRAAVPYLRSHGLEVLALGSKDIDLLAPEAGASLAARLRQDDAILVLAALAPNRGRDLATMLKNLRMITAVLAAVRRTPVAHVVYVSSDAVYPWTSGSVTEATAAFPRDPYAAMHLAREDLLCRLAAAPVAILRATQVYAAFDTHDAYGPHRFFRTACAEGRIALFGRGEELRDHIVVDDVVAVLHLCLTHRSSGTLNVATGRSVSFIQVAKLIAGLVTPKPEIVFLPRRQEIFHRQFDTAALHQALPQLRLTPLEEGIAVFAQPVPARDIT